MSTGAPPSERLIALQTAKFLTVGMLVFGVDVVGVWAFHKIMPALFAVSLAYLLAVTVHFWLNRQWVFKDKDGTLATQAVRYIIMSTAGLLTTLLLVELSLHTITHSVVLAKIFAIPPVTILGFSLLKWFVFPSRQP